MLVWTPENRLQTTDFRFLISNHAKRSSLDKHAGTAEKTSDDDVRKTGSVLILFGTRFATGRTPSKGA
jgi:hypothetical protein